jgi:hypothetical protein
MGVCSVGNSSGLSNAWADGAIDHKDILKTIAIADPSRRRNIMFDKGIF